MSVCRHLYCSMTVGWRISYAWYNVCHVSWPKILDHASFLFSSTILVFEYCMTPFARRAWRINQGWLIEPSDYRVTLQEIDTAVPLHGDVLMPEHDEMFTESLGSFFNEEAYNPTYNLHMLYSTRHLSLNRWYLRRGHTITISSFQRRLFPCLLLELGDINNNTILSTLFRSKNA